MCWVSLVMDQYKPYIPEEWRSNPPVKIHPTTVEPTVEPPGLPEELKFTPKQLEELLNSFHKAVEAARVFDRLTGQPDCVDPEKAKLEDRVVELENQLREIREIAISE